MNPSPKLSIRTDCRPQPSHGAPDLRHQQSRKNGTNQQADSVYPSGLDKMMRKSPYAFACSCRRITVVPAECMGLVAVFVDQQGLSSNDVTHHARIARDLGVD